MPGQVDPKSQIVSAVTILCNQFISESDLNEEQIIESVVQGLNEWMKDDVIEFSAD